MLEYHPDILQHFLEEGAYPIRQKFDMFEDNPWLCRTKEDLLALDKSHPVPDDLLAAWWKFRFEEEREENRKMYGAIQELNRKIG